MASAITLHGMAWDHPRGRDPLEAISAMWSRDRDVRVEWDARPLKAFEDQPLEELATAFDFVLIDHPFAETAATSGLILAVQDWVDEAYLADQAAHSVGPSFASYTWAGRQWALAIDAACQVSAVREDLWDRHGGGPLPLTWREVHELARKLQRSVSRVAMPLNSNHAYCAFLSAGVSLAGAEFWPAGEAVDATAGIEALSFLRELALALHWVSRDADPIAVSDRMATSDEILYVPLMFGYSSYARTGFRARPIRFADAPRGSTGHHGSVLGGVGLALSSRSRHQDLAAELARLIGSPEVQSGLYVDSGGQPGHASAWESRRANQQTGDFFLRTRQTIDHAFVRPTVSGHRRFQERAGELIHHCIWGRELSARECLAQYSALTDRYLANWR